MDPAVFPTREALHDALSEHASPPITATLLARELHDFVAGRPFIIVRRVVR
jgi:hypothetical protein